MNIKLFTTEWFTHDINLFFFFPLSVQVWFQNRRMKDKRQRIAIAWPYAAIYSDPTMAASILQACANSVGMAPYGGYGHAQLMPQMPVMSPQMPANHFSYSPYRYAPYPIPPPQRTPGANQTSAQYPLLNGSLTGSNQMNYGPITIPKPQCTPPDILQSPASQHSALSLSPGSDKEHNHNKYDLSSSSNDNSPVKSLASTPQGLLMTAPQSSPSQTLLPVTPEKPKLFKPYKSEA